MGQGCDCDWVMVPPQVSQGLRELQQSIISAVLRLPGNDCCCDCASHNGMWRPSRTDHGPVRAPPGPTRDRLEPIPDRPGTG